MQIHALEQDKLTLQGEAEVMYEECDRHTAQLALVTQQLALVTDHLALVDNELRTLKESHVETMEERDRLLTVSEGVRERVSDLEDRLTEQELSRADLEEVYDDLVDEHKAVDAQARALKEDNQRLQEEVERAEEEKEKLSTALETLRREIQERAEKVSQQEEEEALMAVVVGEKRERHLATLDVRLTLLSDDNRSLRHENMILTSRVNEAYEVNQQLREELDDLYDRSLLLSASSSNSSSGGDDEDDNDGGGGGGEGGKKWGESDQNHDGHAYNLRPRRPQTQGVSLEELQGIDDEDDDDDDDSDYVDDFHNDEDDEGEEDENELSRQLGLDEEDEDEDDNGGNNNGDDNNGDDTGLGINMREGEGELVAYERHSVLEEAYQCLVEEHEAIITQARAWKEDNNRLQTEVVTARAAAEEALEVCHQAEGALEGSRQRYVALEEAYQVLCEEHAEAVRQVNHSLLTTLNTAIEHPLTNLT